MWSLVVLAVVALVLLAWGLLQVSRSWTTSTRQTSIDRAAQDATTRQMISTMATAVTTVSELAQTMVFGPGSRPPTTGEPATTPTASAPTSESDLDSIPLGEAITAVTDREAEEESRASLKREQLRSENEVLRRRLAETSQFLSEQGVDPSSLLTAPLRPSANGNGSPMSPSPPWEGGYPADGSEPLR